MNNKNIALIKDISPLIPLIIYFDQYNYYRLVITEHLRAYNLYRLKDFHIKDELLNEDQTKQQIGDKVEWLF